METIPAVLEGGPGDGEEFDAPDPGFEVPIYVSYGPRVELGHGSAFFGTTHKAKYRRTRSLSRSLPLRVIYRFAGIEEA